MAVTRLRSETEVTLPDWKDMESAILRLGRWREAEYESMIRLSAMMLQSWRFEGSWKCFWRQTTPWTPARGYDQLKKQEQNLKELRQNQVRLTMT